MPLFTRNAKTKEPLSPPVSSEENEEVINVDTIDSTGSGEDSKTPPPHRRTGFGSYAGQVLSGSILTHSEVKKQYPYIFFMAILMFLYIANGYHIQKLHRHHDQLSDEIRELRSRSMTLSSIRMNSTRQSVIIEELKRRDIPLRESLTPAKVIK